MHKILLVTFPSEPVSLLRPLLYHSFALEPNDQLISILLYLQSQVLRPSISLQTHKNDLAVTCDQCSIATAKPIASAPELVISLSHIDGHHIVTHSKNSILKPHHYSTNMPWHLYLLMLSPLASLKPNMSLSYVK